jgi:hypothetical protein
MTGSAWRNGEKGYNRYLRNIQIRNWVKKHPSKNRVLYDYADIESYWYNSKRSRWEQASYRHLTSRGYVTVPLRHPRFRGDQAGHTTYEGCEQKGKALWWLLARMAGWNPGSSETEKAVISGYVLKDNKPQKGVRLRFSNGGGLAYTRSRGYFSKKLRKGWSGWITPSASCRSFLPVKKSVYNLQSVLTVNFEAVEGTRVMGRVTFDGQGLGGVLLSFSNQGGLALTNNEGYYSHQVPCGWSGVIEPSRQGYTFNPSRRSLKRLRYTRDNLNFQAKIE